MKRQISYLVYTRRDSVITFIRHQTKDWKAKQFFKCLEAKKNKVPKQEIQIGLMSDMTEGGEPQF